MCTIGYCKDLKIVFKNRDKESHITTFEEIVIDSKIMAGRTIGAKYYCWGLNRNGCSFVSAAVNTPKWGQLLYDGKINNAVKQYNLENKGLINPMITVSYMLPDLKNIEEWVKALKESKQKFKSYNLIIADEHKAYHIELYKENCVIMKIHNNKVITNHFTQIDHGPKTNEDYPSTYRRLNYAGSKINTVNSIRDIKSILKPKKINDAKQIWRDGVFKTISSSILNYGKCKVFYAKDINESYSGMCMRSPKRKGKIKRCVEKNSFEMSRYIDLNLYHDVEESHPFYKEMSKAICDKIQENLNPKKNYRVLELGAGTGLFTAKLLKIPNLKVTALELDQDCCKKLDNYLGAEKNIIIKQGNAVEYCEDNSFDFVVSTFSHDHIHFDLADKFVNNIKDNLKGGGIYLMGGEILPNYNTIEERENALYLYHGMIVSRALKNKDYRLAQIEINALESGVNMIGDFKRSEKIFEKEMDRHHFKLLMKEKKGPKDQNDVGGVYVYTFQK